MYTYIYIRIVMGHGRLRFSLSLSPSSSSSSIGYAKPKGLAGARPLACAHESDPSSPGGGVVYIEDSAFTDNLTLARHPHLSRSLSLPLSQLYRQLA